MAKYTFIDIKCKHCGESITGGYKPKGIEFSSNVGYAELWCKHCLNLSETGMKSVLESKQDGLQLDRFVLSVFYGLASGMLVAGILGVQDGGDLLLKAALLSPLTTAIIYAYFNFEHRAYIQRLIKYEDRIKKRPLTRGMVVGVQFKNDEQIDYLEEQIRNRTRIGKKDIT